MFVFCDTAKSQDKQRAIDSINKWIKKNSVDTMNNYTPISFSNLDSINLYIEEESRNISSDLAMWQGRKKMIDDSGWSKDEIDQDVYNDLINKIDSLQTELKKYKKTFMGFKIEHSFKYNINDIIHNETIIVIFSPKYEIEVIKLYKNTDAIMPTLYQREQNY